MKKITYSGMKIFNHSFMLPLDYNNPSLGKIEIFAREVYSKKKNSSHLPYLVYLQGGPGYESPRPITNSGWLKYALKYYRVLFLDQRGTGNSTPINYESLSKLNTEQAANKISLYRADNIVRDAEEIRKKLIKNQKWSILGQSFGGFCATHYLSYFQDSLERVFITGGLPPLEAHPDQIYKRTYKRVQDKNLEFYKIFPQAKNNSKKIAEFLINNKIYLPNNDLLSVERFQQLGLNLGFSDGMATLNYLFENAFTGGKLSYSFLKNIMSLQSFDTNPFFTILHEACYAQNFATNWSAQRIRGEMKQFDPTKDDFLFTGEMLFPWMMDIYQELLPYKKIADTLAMKTDWPSLYDKSTLQKNKVPVAAAVYTNDMFVDRDYSLETASHIKDIKIWETNELEHNGLRSAGEKVLKNLFKRLEVE